MSEECCGVEEPRHEPWVTKTKSARSVVISRSPNAAGDACCGPVEPTPESSVHEEGGACCGPSVPRCAEHEDMPPWWRDRTLVLPAVSGLFWATGLVLELTELGVPALVAFVLGLAAGAWTFVPGTLKKLFIGRGRGRLGVGC